MKLIELFKKQIAWLFFNLQLNYFK
jgi:hypothetical protein